ncbi:tetratricopeptide repeat protein [Sorangium sp. So ce542]|uniref:tetratricopeptide repeat protein n=1 Tax=Sorangium sp. So ce542 TaxID=3133316 RepID=UPI003F5F2DEE
MKGSPAKRAALSCHQGLRSGERRTRVRASQGRRGARHPGDALLARSRVDDAKRWVRAALEAEPEHADALVLLGHVLLRRGDVSGAREHAVWALRTDGSDPDALRRLAVSARPTPS